MQQEGKYDLSAYEFKPDLIYRINPAPNYPDDDDVMPTKSWTKRKYDLKVHFERFRNTLITKSAQEQRVNQGRLYSHLKLEENKQQIEKMQEMEKSIENDLKRKSQQESSGIPNVIYDEEFKLPYGLGFDKVIKKNKEQIDSQKQWNNKLMDELVQKLGYMDYRDALVCNKYILEAKRQKDYHQQARAQVLQYAMQKYNQLKRSEIENKLKEKSEYSQADQNKKNQMKLDLILNTDPEMAKVYRDSYEDIKEDKESDYNETMKIHNKFDYLFDPHSKHHHNRVIDKKYDLGQEKKTEEDEILSDTEMSDPLAQDIYLRYKLVLKENQESYEELDAKADQMVKEFEAGKPIVVNGQEIKEKEEFYNYLYKYFGRQHQRRKFNSDLENYMTQIRLMHELNNLDNSIPFVESDPIYKDEYIQDFEDIDRISDMPDELKRFIKVPRAELQERDFPVYDEESQRDYEDYNEQRLKYFRAKKDHYVQKVFDYVKATTSDIETKLYHRRQLDEQIEQRANFMYNYLDYDNDRTIIRNRFLKEMNKKTTLADIGEILDKLILDEKAEGIKYYDPEIHRNEVPKSATKDYTNVDFSWSGRLMNFLDPIKPLSLDDPSELENSAEGENTAEYDILRRIKKEDEERDHSYKNLTKDEKTEIALFHSIKQDPYFKHYMQNHMRQFAEDQDEINLNFMSASGFENHLTDHVKFDRISLYDFRRQLPQHERQPIIDSKGCAWGFGKRKTSKAIVRIRPGGGRVTINGKPLLQYFFLPSQRHRILLPLDLTRYTCLVDVDAWIHGGGLTGQCEAMAPAISKALQKFDIKTRIVLKYYKQLRNDTRQVERKKFGRIKARKGQVYRRR